MVMLKEIELAERHLRLLICTWNVGNASARPNELTHWLPEAGGDLDLVVVGTQENSESEVSVSMSPADMTENSNAGWNNPKPASGKNELGHAWDEMLAARLGSDWGICKKITLREMRLIIFARAALLSGADASMAVSDVKASRSATGIASVWGNKGGLAIKLRVGQTTLAFVSAHLAAHDHKLKARNEMCKEILRETRSIGLRDLDVASEFDHCFWFGDLNYRIDLNALAVQDKPEFTSRGSGDGSGRLSSPMAELTEDNVAAAKLQALYRGRTGRLKALVPHPEHEEHWSAVCNLVDREDWAALLAADQLRKSIAAGAAFSEFCEGDPTFAPTFKVERAEGTKYKEQRIPSYTDRILWRSMPHLQGAIRQISLASAPSVSTSDHKPVISTFELSLSNPPALLPPPARSTQINAPLVQLSECSIVGNFRIQAGVGDTTAQPFFWCYTNPPGVLGGRAPKSGVIKRDRMGGPMSALEKPREASSWTWDETEVPLLRPAVRGSDLKHVSLILCFYDKDTLSANDPLGTVTVQLSPPPSAGPGANQYTIHVDAPLRYYNVTKRTGRFRCNLNIYFGAALAPALARAHQAGAGTKVRGLGDACCGVM